MSRICVIASPLNCRWIVRGSEVRLGEYAYALCQRMRTRDRIVNEADCARCPLWLEPEDVRSEYASEPGLCR